MKLPKNLLLAVFFLALAGCSKQDWLAKIYMIKGENSVAKAQTLKTHKAPYQIRIPYYQKACVQFGKAYEYNPNVFTLTRIEEAIDSCWRVGDKDHEEKFREFEDIYAKKHPKEYEYGDAGMNMIDAGS